LIVLDASIVVELIRNGPLVATISRRLAQSDESFIAPHLLDVELMSAVRRLSTTARLDSHRINQVIQQLLALPIERYPHLLLLDRMWELRHNFTCYDAAYIALAEATNSTLYTLDAKLCKGHRARVFHFT
jgi:predicted nucleic acid-binding protein